VKATLHDELMQEAGFDVEYYRELDRRRERRERRLRPARAVLRFVGRRLGIDSESWTEPSLPKPRVEARRTLNDELLHEAGFETDYERYRAWRRQRGRRARLAAVSVVLSAAAVFEKFGRFVPGIPRSVVYAAIGIPAGFAAIVLIGRGVTWLRAEHSRREIRRVMVRAASLVLIVAAVVQLAAPYLPGIPKSIVIAALLLGLAVEVVGFVKTRLLPWMEDQI
jgi:hypothetical protein